MPVWLQLQFWEQRYPLILPRLTDAVARILLTLLLYALARWLLGRVVHAVLTSLIHRSGPGREGQAQRLHTLHGLLRSIINYLLIFIAAVMILDAVGLNIAAILAGAGVVGMAVGFGAQRLVRDVITGFFILMEDQYAVGDRITVGDYTGVVQEIGMRITRLRDDAGKLVMLANGDITAVTNHSRGPLVTAVEVNLPRQTDLEALRAELARPVYDLDDGPLLSPPSVRGITDLDAGSITVRVTASARPGRQQEAELLLRDKLHEVLAAALAAGDGGQAGSRQGE